MNRRTSYIGSGRPYIHYTDEQLSSVRNTDMVDFLGRKEGFTFVKAGAYYKCVEHNSLVICPDRKMWFWNSQNLNGLNCIVYLLKVVAMSFQSACKELIGLDSSEMTRFEKAEPIHNKEPPELQIPPKAKGNYKNVFMYLTDARCIPQEIVTYCFHNKLIYQDTSTCAVFVGYDENGAVRCLERRSTNTYINKFRGNTRGSDLRYSFHINADKELDKKDDKRVYVFEAPIDLLSHAALTLIAEQNRDGTDAKCWLRQNRIALSGLTTKALDKYLELNPQTAFIDLCLDNDDAGLKAAETIRQMYSDRYNVTVHRVKGCKDYNEALQGYTKRLREREKQEEELLTANSVRR